MMTKISKTLKSICVPLMIVLYGCVSEREYIVESDYSYNGKFKRYKTFDFLKSPDEDTIHVYHVIRKTMLKRLQSQGYVKSERKPDLYISYKLFRNDFYFKGFEQPNFEHWLGDNASFVDHDADEESTEMPLLEENESKPSNQSQRENYVEHKYQMNEGTLFVVFYDRKLQKAVWHGYASGVFAKGDHRSDRSIYVAASKILNEFRLIAEGFLIK